MYLFFFSVYLLGSGSGSIWTFLGSWIRIWIRMKTYADPKHCSLNHEFLVLFFPDTKENLSTNGYSMSHIFLLSYIFIRNYILLICTTYFLRFFCFVCIPCFYVCFNPFPSVFNAFLTASQAFCLFHFHLHLSFHMLFSCFFYFCLLFKLFCLLFNHHVSASQAFLPASCLLQK